MSEENVEVVRRGFAAFNRGDFDAAIAVFRADAVWHSYLAMLEGEVHRGHEAIVKMWADLHDYLSGFQVQPKEFIDCGEAVVVVVEATGTGTGSGAAVAQTWAQLWSLKDGLVSRVEPFPTRTEALEAAGLSE
jgi:ketosteroid isomerase-like protein